MIKVEHIAKKYGKVEALQDISFEVLFSALQHPKNF
jgi:ABC-type uncharacterized transport system ATPase subunit